MGSRLSTKKRISLLVAFILFGCLPSFAKEADEKVSESVPKITQASPLVTSGMELEITVFREPELSGTYTVDHGGSITFPLTGKIKVTGMDQDQVTQAISQALKTFILNPEVTVTIPSSDINRALGGSSGLLSAVSADGGNASISVIVFGEVRRPGAYQMTGDLTLTKLIAEVGGFTAMAYAAKIKLIRTEESGQVVTSHNFDEINLANAEDPLIQKGDKIIIPARVKDISGVAILGQVKSTGIYETAEGLTLMRLIAKAGGFTPLAARNKVRVVRDEAGKKKVYIYNATSIIAGRAEDPEVKPGDMVFIPETFF